MLDNIKTAEIPLRADPINRLDNLRPQRDLPAHIAFGREVRVGLSQQEKKDGLIPQVPKHLTSAEDLFEAAQKEVTKKWDKNVLKSMDLKRKQWIECVPQKDEFKKIRELLSNPKKFEQSIRMRQFSILEPLRHLGLQGTDIWLSLLAASSERQLASIVLTRAWLNVIPEDQIQQWGISKAELSLFLDTAELLGKYFDQAYIKQTLLADQPGGSVETPLSNVQGGKYIYDSQKTGGENVRIPYKEVFSSEWPKIVSRLELLMHKSQLLLDLGKLPSQYKNMPQFFQKLAQVYGSSETNPSKLFTMWNELYATGQRLAEDGCPIMIIPQECAQVADKAHKVDVEIRLGLISQRSRSIDPLVNIMHNMAAKIVKKYWGDREIGDIPKIIVNYQPYSFGPNLYQVTKGESQEDSLVCHVNPTMESAKAIEFPLLNIIRSKNKMNDQDYAKATVIISDLHEQAHNVLSNGNKVINSRVGESDSADIYDELKADTVDMKLLLEAQQAGQITFDKNHQGNAIYVNAENLFMAKLGASLYNVVSFASTNGASDERYFLSGVFVLQKLLEKGMLVHDGNKYVITDYMLGLKEIASMGEHFLEVYSSDQTNPDTITTEVQRVRLVREKPKIKELLEQLNEPRIQLGTNISLDIIRQHVTYLRNQLFGKKRAAELSSSMS